MQTLRTSLFAVLLLVVGAACNPASGPPGPSGPSTAPVTLAGTTWQLVAIDGRPVPAASRLTLELTPDRVSGNGGCNSFGGAYRFDPATGALAIGDLVSTKRACLEPAANDLEQAYLAALGRSTSAAIDATGRLVLSGGGQLLFGRTA